MRNQNSETKSNRYFTVQAREAAAAARQRRSAERKSHESRFSALSVIIVRSTIDCSAYVWQIRRFGAFIVQQSEECFVSAALANDAGQAALHRMVQWD